MKDLSHRRKERRRKTARHEACHILPWLALDNPCSVFVSDGGVFDPAASTTHTVFGFVTYTMSKEYEAGSVKRLNDFIVEAVACKIAPLVYDSGILKLPKRKTEEYDGDLINVEKIFRAAGGDIPLTEEDRETIMAQAAVRATEILQKYPKNLEQIIKVLIELPDGKEMGFNPQDFPWEAT
jgi:hypothetical protein